MVLAYWLIGRELVQELRGGDERAEYGKQVVESLSARLTEKYGRGFSTTNLLYFRQFFQVYSTRMEILSPPGREPGTSENLRLTGGELISTTKGHSSRDESQHRFSPQLSWSHYRALMRVRDIEAREFYEREATECGWTKSQLERQIQSSYFQRIIANRGKAGLIATDRERLPGALTRPETILKTPYVPEFLGLPDSPELHEDALEQAIIDNLQSFLLELGKGSSFVARQ